MNFICQWHYIKYESRYIKPSFHINIKPCLVTLLFKWSPTISAKYQIQP
jgi:hypothetical protein